MSFFYDVTLSNNEIGGKFLPLWGAGVFDGDEDWPLPNAHTMIMKYFYGSRAIPSPINHSLSLTNPVNQVGYRITLFLSLLRIP